MWLTSDLWSFFSFIFSNNCVKTQYRRAFWEWFLKQTTFSVMNSLESALEKVRLGLAIWPYGFIYNFFFVFLGVFFFSFCFNFAPFGLKYALSPKRPLVASPALEKVDCITVLLGRQSFAPNVILQYQRIDKRPLVATSCRAYHFSVQFA